MRCTCFNIRIANQCNGYPLSLLGVGLLGFGHIVPRHLCNGSDECGSSNMILQFKTVPNLNSTYVIIDILDHSCHCNSDHSKHCCLSCANRVHETKKVNYMQLRDVECILDHGFFDPHSSLPPVWVEMPRKGTSLWLYGPPCPPPEIYRS